MNTTTTMNTGAASLLPCPFCGSAAYIEQPGTRRQSCIVECGSCGLRHDSGDEGAMCGTSWNRRATPTPQADAAPIINGHAINDLFLKWSEWTTELGEAISRKNIDGFVSELRAAIAAGGAQEADNRCPDCFGAGVYAKAAVLPEPPDIKCLRCNGRGTLYAAPLPRVAAAVSLTDEQIVSIWEGMPDGASGFRKSWGYMQFARALLAASNGEQA